MTTNHAWKAITTLDLGQVKVKLMHRQSGEGWDQAKADAVEVEYKRFLHLSKEFPNELIAPSQAVDTFWHYHILDTVKYAADCAAVFGYFLHHNPNVGLDDAEPAARQHGAERMQSLYAAVFDAPAPAAGAYCTRAADGSTAYCTRAADLDAGYCTRAAADGGTAYCTRAAVNSAAYCTRADDAGSAYCTRAAVAAPSYCTRAADAATAAYCTRVQPPAEAAYCTRAPVTGSDEQQCMDLNAA